MICTTLFLFLNFQDDWKALEKALQAAVERDDAQEALKLARGAVDNGSIGHVKVVAIALSHAGLRVYWAMLDALRGVKSEAGLAFLTDEVLALKGKPEGRDLAQLVLDSKFEKKDELIARLLDGTDDSIRVACIDVIVKEERKSLIPKLIDLLQEEEKGAKKSPAGTALRNLTGLDLGPSPAWKGWWEKNGKTFEFPNSNAVGSNDTVVGYLKRNRRTQYEELRNGNKRRIVVIRGDADRIETILDKLKIPYTLASNDQVVNGVFDSKTTVAILENCLPQGAAGKSLGDSLRQFVESGGSLFGSHVFMDMTWTVFPGYGKAVGCRDKESAEIFPARGILIHSLMRGLFDDRVPLKWKLHEGTTFQAHSEKVVVLVESPDLGSRKGTSAPLAGYFRHGDKGGMVAFVAGHFANQETKEGEFTLQNLLLNFLIEAQENFRARGGK